MADIEAHTPDDDRPAGVDEPVEQAEQVLERSTVTGEHLADYVGT